MLTQTLFRTSQHMFQMSIQVFTFTVLGKKFDFPKSQKLLGSITVFQVVHCYRYILIDPLVWLIMTLTLTLCALNVKCQLCVTLTKKLCALKMNFTMTLLRNCVLPRWLNSPSHWLWVSFEWILVTLTGILRAVTMALCYSQWIFVVLTMTFSDLSMTLYVLMILVLSSCSCVPTQWLCATSR